jgi:hypothetical protein
MSDRNRAIDALIAERAMGHGVCSCDHKKTKSPRFNADNGLCLTCNAPALVRYSTDPADSKKLRDRMRELGWCYLIQLREGIGGYLCRFYRGNDYEEHDGTASTEELAIALAALSALGIEAPQ